MHVTVLIKKYRKSDKIGIANYAKHAHYQVFYSIKKCDRVAYYIFIGFTMARKFGIQSSRWFKKLAQFNTDTIFLSICTCKVAIHHRIKRQWYGMSVTTRIGDMKGKKLNFSDEMEKYSKLMAPLCIYDGSPISLSLAYFFNT